MLKRKCYNVQGGEKYMAEKEVFITKLGSTETLTLMVEEGETVGEIEDYDGFVDKFGDISLSDYELWANGKECTTDTVIGGTNGRISLQILAKKGTTPKGGC